MRHFKRWARHRPTALIEIFQNVSPEYDMKVLNLAVIIINALFVVKDKEINK